MEQQQPIKATLDGSPTIIDSAQYFVDFSKLTKIEELILILAAMGINFNPKHPYFNSIKHLLNLDQPILLENGTLPVEKGIKLPQLKTLKKDGE